MSQLPTTPVEAPHILLLTREPVLHERGGSTTYVLSLLQLLRAQGCEVTVVVTGARSRSPRLYFRRCVPVPDGVRYLVPETWQLGSWYARPLSWRAWLRFGLRVCGRLPLLCRATGLLQGLAGDRVTSVAWDLGELTAGERALALRYVAATGARTVIGNYAFWGSLFDAPSLRTLRCCVLMHDLLSARVERFRAGGLPLDCPLITRATELAWLDGADCLLAAQSSEADAVRPFTQATVLVQPMVLTPEPVAAEPVPGRVLFVGSNITPNRTGLRWLLERVWPLVRQTSPDAVLAIAGTVCAALEPADTAAGRGVVALGQVDSLALEYARAQVVTVPLLVGSGLKIKLVEALAYGRATVSTRVGVQGVEAWAADAVAVTDDPAEFSAAIVQLLADPALRASTEQRSRALAELHFGAHQPLPPQFRQCVLGEAPQPADDGVPA